MEQAPSLNKDLFQPEEEKTSPEASNLIRQMQELESLDDSEDTDSSYIRKVFNTIVEKIKQMKSKHDDGSKGWHSDTHDQDR